MDLATKHRVNLEDQEECINEQRQKLRALIGQRKEARAEGIKRTVKETSKEIQKEIRAISRAKKKAQIGNILKEFRGLRDIADIRGGRKKQQTGSMKDQNAEVVTDRRKIADVFADFYGDLYSRRETYEDATMGLHAEGAAVPTIAAEEVAKELNAWAGRRRETRVV